MTKLINVKCRSRALGHSACLKTMLRTITLQGLALAAITASEKCSLKLESTKNHDKANGMQNLGQGQRVIVCA